jgi:hypothetical protein
LALKRGRVLGVLTQVTHGNRLGDQRRQLDTKLAVEIVNLLVELFAELVEHDASQGERSTKNAAAVCRAIDADCLVTISNLLPMATDRQADKRLVRAV